MVDHLDELDDIDHGAVGHGGRDVARDGVFQRGAHVGAGQLLRPGALAAQDIAVALHHDAPRAEHVGQLADLLRVGDGLVERLGKIVADQDRQVGVGAFEVLVAVAVDNGEVIVVVFLRDKAAGVLAEGADLVFPGGGVADQLAFVQNAVDRLHDLVAAFDPHADVDGAGAVGDVVLGADLFKPVCPAAAGGDDDPARRDLAPVRIGPAGAARNDAAAGIALQQDVVAFGLEPHLHARVLQVALDIEVKLLGAFGAQVADRTVDKLQARLDAALADLLDLGAFVHAFHMRVGAEFQVNFIGIVDEVLGKLFADELGQLAADLPREREFAVRKCARAGKAGRDRAGGLAVDAVAGLGFGAVAAFDRLAFFDQQNFQLLRAGAFAQQFKRGEDAGRTGADDDQVVRVAHGV